MTDLTTAQFAERIGVSTRTVERYVAFGRLKPAYRTLGGHKRFTEEQVEQCRENAESTPGSTAEEASTTPSGTTTSSAEPNDFRFVRGILKQRAVASPPSSSKVEKSIDPKGLLD